MKRRFLALSIITLMIAMLAMVSCSSSSFGGEMGDDGKTMNIVAENSEKDDVIVLGSLVIEEGEQVTIDSNLQEGGMKIEFISDEGFDDIEEVPDVGGAEAKYTANVNGVESQAIMFGTGSFIMRVTVTEKATGTVDIVVK